MLGLGTAGVGGTAAAATGASALATDEDHVAGFENHIKKMEAARQAQHRKIDELKAGGGGSWWSGTNAGDQAVKIKELEEGLNSGNFDIGGGKTYNQLKAEAQGKSDLLAQGKQGQGGLKNRLFGYRDQAHVDSHVNRFRGTDDSGGETEIGKRMKALGLTGPVGRNAAPKPAAKPTNPLIPLGATNWDDYRSTYHNPYAGRDWSHLLNTSPAYMGG